MPSSKKKSATKLIHYTVGYGGKLNYHTICGIEHHSHSETEESVIQPEKVTCKKCKATEQWKEDVGHATGKTKTDIKRRIFIESDVLAADELKQAQRQVRYILDDKKEKYIKRIFSQVFDYAWHHLDELWEAVKKADEIYAASSLMPLCGGSYMGAPVIFNGMCERAVKEDITGKSVIILNTLENINWYMIKVDVMKKAFTNNDLYMYDDTYSNLIKVDVSKIKK